MNYLAHLYLSFDDMDIMVGNFIADAVKGNKYHEYPTKIAQGIIIHREIDSYTDAHSIVKSGKRRLGKYRHYAGVIMDVFYDHFLSKNWTSYSKEPLSEFTNRNYAHLKSIEDRLPAKMQYLLSYMADQDWLYNYQYLEGVQFALSGMSQRTKFKSHMEYATNELKEHYEEFEQEFQSFFDEITDHIHNFTDQLINK